MNTNRTKPIGIVSCCLLLALLQGPTDQAHSQGLAATKNNRRAANASVPVTPPPAVSPHSTPASAVSSPELSPPSNLRVEGLTSSTNAIDPFANTPEMVRQAVGPGPGMGATGPGVGLIGLKLRGVIVDDDGHALALLELKDGDVYVVREGETLGFWSGGRSSKSRIQSISRQRVEIAFGDMTDYIIVR